MALAPLLFTSLLTASSPQLTVPVEQYQLQNGLTVILSHDDRLPVVAVEVRYLVGSANEREGRSGFAHLFEHLMFQGSASFDREYFKPFEPIGGEVNGSTSGDRTNYYERVPSNYLELALWMESDRLENFLPVLSEGKLNNQRDVVLNERRQNYEDQPYGMVWEHLAANLHPSGHPYHHTTIGDPADLTAATLTDVQDFFREYYVPANAVLTVVGDFEPVRTKTLVDQYFAHIPAGRRAPAPRAGVPTLDRLIQVTEIDDVKLPRIYLAWPTPPLYAAGDAELDVMASVLSRGKSSRLFKTLVYDKKLAKDVAAFQASQHLSSYFVIYATAAPGTSVQELSSELLGSVEDALSVPPTPKEFEAAINQYKKDYYARVEGVVSRADMLSAYYHMTGSADYLAQDMARYTNLTATQVQAASARWLPLDRHVRIDVVPGPPAAADAAQGRGRAPQ